jgi:hypothetical protein
MLSPRSLSQDVNRFLEASQAISFKPSFVLERLSDDPASEVVDRFAVSRWRL